ncbi:MAG: hypothetical protein C4519_03295 [Desulfobacteraceae bacterium]|nr:MAG: hypothetical protein C4519_03295 [Desulfobacteraceae bacterium]
MRRALLPAAAETRSQAGARERGTRGGSIHAWQESGRKMSLLLIVADVRSPRRSVGVRGDSLPTAAQTRSQAGAWERGEKLEFGNQGFAE